MSRARDVIVLGLVTLVALLAGWWAVRQQSISREHTATISRLEGANRALEEKTAQLERDAAALRDQLVASGVEPPRAAPASRPKPQDEQAASRLESVRLLAQVQARLNSANQAIADLQARQRELEQTIEKLTADNKRLLAEESELKGSLTATKSLVEALEAEMKTKSDRISQLEAAARKSREDTRGATERSTQYATTARELEDLNRRRENFLNSLQRRYRDLTDQYRALAVRLETARDNPVTFAPDVSRIQSAVQLAEEDLRQISSLNTQAQRAAQKLTSR